MGVYAEGCHKTVEYRLNVSCANDGPLPPDSVHARQPLTIMTELSFRIRGWSAWSPGRETEAAWRAWASGIPAPEPIHKHDIKTIPPSLRRRVSPLGQAALRCAWGLEGAADARIVMASRHGEFGRTLSILDALASGDGISPADFTLSVHHALVGLLSIAQQNHRGHTAVAAGPDSFGFGFLEAVSCLSEKPSKSVLFVYYDEPLPAPYADFDEAPSEPLALAICLAVTGDGERFTLEIASSPTEAPSLLPGALDVIAFLLSDASTATIRGESVQWQWRRHAAAA